MYQKENKCTEIKRQTVYVDPITCFKIPKIKWSLSKISSRHPLFFTCISTIYTLHSSLLGGVPVGSSTSTGYFVCVFVCECVVSVVLPKLTATLLRPGLRQALCTSVQTQCYSIMCVSNNSYGV